MLRSDSHPQNSRVDAKRRNINARRKQFADPTYKQQEYPFRLNFYDVPPTAEITLEQFEQWAIDRLRVLAELESTSHRNLSPAEASLHMQPIISKYLPLSSNSSTSQGFSDPLLRSQRQKDHYSHFILRLAFSSTEELRRRFARVERELFRLRWKDDDGRERREWIATQEWEWEAVGEAERRELKEQLAAVGGAWGKREDKAEGGEEWFKVDWERVPELVEGRRVLVRRGKAYVPGREQLSFVLAEFGARLEKALELTSRALPRLSSDSRLTPLLSHLSSSFTHGPLSTLSDTDQSLATTHLTASSIDALAPQHFPLCMHHLHRTLRSTSHLRHFGRLQYTLFLKGLGLSLDECLAFWRRSFAARTDDATFDKQYRYNVRHAYGDVGGDSNRRGRGYAPLSCQRILTEHPPGPGDAHGCPYKHFSADRLAALLAATPGADDQPLLLRGVRDDVAASRFHIACNRVFDWLHRAEITKARADGRWTAAELDTIVHPNTYFKRSFLLKNGKRDGDGDMAEE